MKPFTGVGYRPQQPISVTKHSRIIANIAKQEAAKPYRALKPPHPNLPPLIKAAVTDPVTAPLKPARRAAGPVQVGRGAIGIGSGGGYDPTRR
jgi:hypothetical protein